MPGSTEIPARVQWLLDHPIQTIYEWRDGKWFVIGYRRRPEAVSEIDPREGSVVPGKDADAMP